MARDGDEAGKPTEESQPVLRQAVPMQANQEGGNTLLTTLSLLGILTVSGFVLSQMSVEYLAMTALNTSRQSALDLARSAVSLGLARLSQDPAFGSLDATPTLWVAGERPQDQGLLLFDPQQACRLALPFSLNNLRGTAAKPGSLGDPVPAGSAQLLGIGQEWSALALAGTSLSCCLTPRLRPAHLRLIGGGGSGHPRWKA